MALGSLLFVILGAPVGILFAKRDFLSAFMTCFMPIILIYYPLMLFGVNTSKEGLILRWYPSGSAMFCWRSWPACLTAGHEALSARAPSGMTEPGASDVVMVAFWVEMGRTSVRILDRQRYWSFIKAYVICYFSLVGLYIVIDAFSNLDEFTKRADGMVEITRS